MLCLELRGLQWTCWDLPSEIIGNGSVDVICVPGARELPRHTDSLQKALGWRRQRNRIRCVWPRLYIPFLRSLDMPKQSRVFEWCSGPGFIGFSMLAHGLCETLCLADINDEAVEACQKTIRDNRLEARVAVYESDNLTNIPREEQWDLVVGNPPFYRTNMSRRYEHTTKTGTYIVSSLRRWASS
jgi:hypothetical protein